MTNISERFFQITSELGPEFFGFLLFVSVMIGLLLYSRNAKDMRKKREMARFEETKAKGKKNKKRSKTQEFTYFKSLRKQIKLLYFFKQNPKKEERLYHLILVAEAVIFLFFLIIGKVILALAVPYIFHKFAQKSIELATDSIDLYVEQELPNAIRHVIKALTKTGDLKTVIYEAGKSIREPLRSRFIELSRKLVTENPDEAIMDFAEEIDNTWVYAFSFLLTSYRDASKKRDIVQNLADMASMIEKEALVKSQGITEKKGTVALNNILMGMAIIAFFANLYFTSGTIEFFFETVQGMIMLIAGITMVGFTVIINLVLSKRAI